jgi:hypothetical protein
MDLLLTKVEIGIFHDDGEIRAYYEKYEKFSRKITLLIFNNYIPLITFFRKYHKG